MRFTCRIPARRRARGVILSACLLIVFQLLPSWLAAADRQIIHVQFSIDGQEFENLPSAGRAQIEAEVANKFSTAAENRWGFIDWSPGLSPPADAFEWKIKLRVEVRNVGPGGASTGYIVTLEHSGVLGDKITRFSQTEENETIYGLGSIIPFQNSDDLGEDISKQLDQQLGILLQSDDVKAFLQTIPIVNEVIADSAGTRIVVPVNIQDLRSKQDSVIDVVFIAANSQIGHLTMKTAAEVMDGGQYHGYVIGRVTELLLFPVDISTPTWWDPQLSTVIDSASDVRVYMISYSPSLAGSAATDGDVVLDPDI